MYQLIRGKPIEQINFTVLKAKSGGKYKNKMICDDIFTIDTETTSDYIDENGNPFMFDYDDPDKAQNAIKHSVCYLWQFGINEDTRYIGRHLYELCDLLFVLNKYCPFLKIVYNHNLAFDFNFYENVFRITDVFARKARHPMTCKLPDYNIELKCSYVLTNLKLETWATSLNLPVRKQTGLLKYDVMRTPLTPLTADELTYSIADLDVIFYGIQYYKKMYGHVWMIPMTHTGKMRRACAEVMESERGYCEKVTKLLPQTLDDYIEQAHAFIGGSVFCNWLYKNRLIKEDIKHKIRLPAYDIASSYPWVLISCKYPMTIFVNASLKNYKKYMYNDKYVYIVHFTVENIESNYNCHFMSRSKALSLTGCESDNGRIIRAKTAEFILTSVDYEIFLKCYSHGKIKILSFKWSFAGYLNDKFRRFIIDLYKDKTTLKGVEGMESIYQNKKEYINSCYGDFVTKIFSDQIVFKQNNVDEWTVDELTDESFKKSLKSVNRKWGKNYKAFCQGIFVTAWARKRIWDAVIELDENIMYSDTDSLKLYDYTGDYFDRENNFVLTRHREIADELKIDINDLSPVDVKGNKHPIGVWELESYYQEFKSLGCKQYIYKDKKGLHLTCAGVSKLAVKCFKNCDDFKIDRRLTEKELKACDDGNGHTAEKLTPYYSNDYPVVKYPDGYVCKYKHGVCLMPTTFNLSITPQDLFNLYNEVRGRLNKSYFMKGK